MMSTQCNNLFCKTATWLTDHEPQKSEFPCIPVCRYDASHSDSTNNTNELVLERGARELFSYHQVHVILQGNNDKDEDVGMVQQKNLQVLEPKNLE